MERSVISQLMITYNISMNIYDIIHGIDDKVEMGINNLKSRKYKIYHSSMGAYFKYDGIRYYLSNFLKVQ